MARYQRVMFFYLSKIVWFLADPGNILLIGLCLGTVLVWTRWARRGRWLLTLVAGVALFIAVVPVGRAIIADLENRFPQLHEGSGRIDGIIVLGGVLKPQVSKARGRSSLGGGAERLTEFARLAKRHPQARLVFTGGTGTLTNQDVKEAHYVAPFLRRLGLEGDRVVYEDQSRNTAENAQFTKKLMAPKKGERWILITAAFHMPRAVGAFRRVGWPVLPDPVNFTTRSDEVNAFRLRRFNFNLRAGLGTLSKGLHEWLGLVFYRLTGRTETLYPAPGDSAGN